MAALRAVRVVVPGGGFGRAGGARGGAGGFLNSTTSSPALTKLLKADASHYTWVAATVNSDSASGYQLASMEPVMAIGGFNGTDPSPTLAQFEKYVAEKKIHYFIAGGGGLGGGSGSDDASQITSWVESHFTSQTVGGTTIYNLRRRRRHRAERFGSYPFRPGLLSLRPAPAYPVLASEARVIECDGALVWFFSPQCENCTTS